MSNPKNTPLVEIYLFFNGRCDEAIEFYKKAVGARLEMLMRFKESPDPMPPGSVPSGFEDKVMHASFHVGQTRIMASDGCSPDKAVFDGFSLSLSVANEAEADKAFAALSEGGEVTMPMGKTFWSPRFGMLKDRFGIGWMVTVAVENPAGKK